MQATFLNRSGNPAYRWIVARQFPERDVRFYFVDHMTCKEIISRTDCQVLVVHSEAWEGIRRSERHKSGLVNMPIQAGRGR